MDQTRRYASESLIDTFFSVILTSCQKHFSTKAIPSRRNFKMLIVLGRPKGPNQMLRIRILDRYVFNTISTSCQNHFFTKTIASGMNFKIFIVLGRPNGPNQTLRIRILDRYLFNMISTSGGHLDYIWW